MREKIRKMVEAFDDYHAALHRGGSGNRLEIARLDYEMAFLEAVAAIAGPSPAAKLAPGRCSTRRDEGETA